MLNGIDISNNQGCIDFMQVKNSEIEIVYVKATEGLTYTDPNLIDNYNKAKAAGLKVGFYHFLRNNDPVAEANHFLQAIQSLQADCLHMIDVELALGQTTALISSNVKRFADYLISQSKQVGIYTDLSFYQGNLDDSVKSYPLWIADYCANEPSISNMVGWQFSETGNISGISGNVDLDDFSDSILIQGVKKVEYLVVVNRGADENSAEILADFLNCPVIKNDRQFDYSCVKNVIGVGGNAGQYTSYLTKLIAGVDRFSTNQAVLDFIANGDK